MKRPTPFWCLVACEVILLINRTEQIYAYRGMFADGYSGPAAGVFTAMLTAAVLAAYGLGMFGTYALRDASPRLRHAFVVICFIGLLGLSGALRQIGALRLAGRITLTSPASLFFLYHYCLLMGLGDMAAAQGQTALADTLRRGFFIYLFCYTAVNTVFGLGIMLLWEHMSLAAQGGNTVLLLTDIANIPIFLSLLYLIHLLWRAGRLSPPGETGDPGAPPVE